MPVPTPRAVLLLALGLALPLVAGTGGWAVAALVAYDLALLALVSLDARRAPGSGQLHARRTLREPLTAFAVNQVWLHLTSAASRPVRVDLADAPPPGFDAAGHRARLTLPAGGEARLAYQVTPRSRGRHAFGDLHLRVSGPLGLAWRRLTLPLAGTTSAYPDLRAAAGPAGGAVPEAGQARHRGWHEGREFAALRPYAAGDDVRAIDWKATARRGAPVVREWQPERNQTVWLLVDCGRHLAARLPDGRTKLDRAVDAALALGRAAAARGDRTGAILYGAEVERVVPPEGGRTRLGPLAEALHLARARPVESDLGAAFEALAARQRRRALVLIFTDLSDPEASALLLARAALLRRRHLVLVAAVSDPAVVEAAQARPRDQEAAFVRAAAERLLDEQEATSARLVAAGIAVTRVAAAGLAAAVVERYLDVKARGAL
ncbi:MAG: DUF58 domain-containing protein [Anaeromyxobacter sp.]|nr:DUF58 domain-containing protein [Anaeromyxobacter sp.]MBL0276732.1 DUF58 domain-containing protein [Anaeromyxobacter sp.]